MTCRGRSRQSAGPARAGMKREARSWTGCPAQVSGDLLGGLVTGAREKVALRLVPERAWEAIDAKGKVRERCSDDACADQRRAHRRCWIEEAHVTELTRLSEQEGNPGARRPRAPGPTARPLSYPATT